MTGRTATGIAQVRHEEQGYAPAVSSREDSRSAADGLSGAYGDAARELAWVDVMAESDRRLFAEEMSRLMAEAAKTDDLAPVEQALREWRATAEVHTDPVLSRRLSGPLVAKGARVPRPDV